MLMISWRSIKMDRATRCNIGESFVHRCYLPFPPEGLRGLLGPNPHSFNNFLSGESIDAVCKCVKSPGRSSKK